MGNDNNLEFRSLRLEANECCNRGNFERAIGIYEDTLLRYHDYDQICERACCELGEIYLLLRELSSAQNYLNLAIGFNPLKTRYHYLLGLSDAAGSKWNNALSEFQFCCDRQPAKHKYQWLFGITCWCAGNHRAGIDYIDNILALPGARMSTIADIAADILYLPVTNQAIAYIHHAAQIIPDNIQVNRLLKELVELQHSCNPANYN